MLNFNLEINTLSLVVFLTGLLLSGCAGRVIHPKDGVKTAHFNLAAVEIRSEYLPYKEFCSRNVGECDMAGSSVVEHSDYVESLLSKVNISVNHEIKFTLDIDEYQQEEYWSYPHFGKGDCEDIALEKRARLTQSGLPRGALLMAIVHDRKNLSPHGVLLVETTQGTYLLDSIVDQVSLWYRLPYNYESRERQDGTWERFDQVEWVFD
jgi:predicted transglutaminase-like cysteine proteinase